MNSASAMASTETLSAWVVVGGELVRVESFRRRLELPKEHQDISDHVPAGVLESRHRPLPDDGSHLDEHLDDLPPDVPRIGFRENLE